MSRRWLLCGVLALAMNAQPVHAETQAWFGFALGIAKVMPAPSPWRSEPRVLILDGVSVVSDERCNDDVFRTGDIWWRLSGGWWYRSTNWRGPWMAVDVRRVPETVLIVPARHWKHHPRYGQGRLKRHDFEHEDHKNEREHGRGHGHGHD